MVALLSSLVYLLRSPLLSILLSLLSDFDLFFFKRIQRDSYVFDLTVEYCITNVENMRLSGKFSDIIDRIVYVPSLKFPYMPDRIRYNTRQVELLTTIQILDHPGDPGDEFGERQRRLRLLESFATNNISVKNLNNIYKHHDIRKLYDDTKILINIP